MNMHTSNDFIKAFTVNKIKFIFPFVFSLIMHDE